MKKFKSFALPIAVISVAPFLVACQVSDQSKLDHAFNNLNVLENKSDEKLPKEETYPSSLGTLDFIGNVYSDVKSRMWIQPHDQEGKVDVFVTLSYGNTKPKTKKFTFENYNSQKNTITSQKQLDDILDSLSIEFKVDESKTVASQIIAEDVYVIKGETILDSAYDIEINLKANEEKSQLLASVILKKDGFISAKKDFLLRGFLDWEKSDNSKKPRPSAPTDWPDDTKILATQFSFEKVINSLIGNAREIADIGQRVSKNYVFDILPKVDLKELKSLPEKLQNNFKKFFIKIKNLSKKTEFLGLNTYSSWFYSELPGILSLVFYNDNTKIMVNELKILMQDFQKDFIELAQSFNPDLTAEQITKQLQDLNKINQLVNNSETESKNRGAIELINKLFDIQLYDKNTNYIKNLKVNCENGACQLPQDNQEYFYNLSLVYGQISYAILQSQYTLYANNLVAQEQSIKDVFLKSFEKQNVLLPTIVEKAQLNEKFVENVGKMYEFYESLEINVAVRKFKRLFNKNLENLENIDESFRTELEDIHLAIMDIEQTYTETIAIKNNQDGNGGHDVHYPIGGLIEKIDNTLKEVSKKPFKTFGDFSTFFPQINDIDYYMKILKSNLLKAKNGAQNLNQLFTKVIPQLEAAKAKEQANNVPLLKIGAYDSLLTSFKVFQQAYPKLEQNINLVLNQSNVYDFLTMSNNVSNLNQLANAYISQVALDGIDFVKEQFLDPTYLVLPSKTN